MAQASWGQGYGTEGSRALIDKAFTELGARRVHASTMKANRGSWRVMEKAGMRFVRLSFGEWPGRIPGDEAGDVEYAITREEWVVATTLRSRDHTADPPLHPRQRDL